MRDVVNIAKSSSRTRSHIQMRDIFQHKAGRLFQFSELSLFKSYILSLSDDQTRIHLYNTHPRKRTHHDWLDTPHLK